MPKYDWGRKGFKEQDIKRVKGTFGITPNSGPSGHVVGSPTASKGANKAAAIKHDGIVLGGSITSGKESVGKKSIDKLSNPRTDGNVLGK